MVCLPLVTHPIVFQVGGADITSGDYLVYVADHALGGNPPEEAVQPAGLLDQASHGLDLSCEVVFQLVVT